jgi:hypothetical protein
MTADRSQVRRVGFCLTGLSSAAVCAIRVVMWAMASPLEELRSQLVDGRTPVGGWTIDRLAVDASAGGLAVATAAVTLLLFVNVAAACWGSVLPTLDALAARITPASLRRLGFALCGVALTAPAVSGAAAADDSGHLPPPLRACRPSLSGLPLPDLPSSPPASTITVHHGDSLWSIAESELAPQARNTAVAAEAALLYATNRRTIGTNPDRIFPGQRLLAPGGAS